MMTVNISFTDLFDVVDSGQWLKAATRSTALLAQTVLRASQNLPNEQRIRLIVRNHVDTTKAANMQLLENVAWRKRLLQARTVSLSFRNNSPRNRIHIVRSVLPSEK